jgi:hypothetical protein
MTDTTNIDDLPGSNDNTNVVLEKTEIPDYQKMHNETKQQENSIDNQKIMNKLVSDIQQASAIGATQLPSRDIPMDTLNITQDEAVIPNYVPKEHNDDYINENDNTEDYLLNSEKVDDTLEHILETLQVPLLLGILYFMFQLPIIRKYFFSIFPSLFESDGNQTLGGYMFFSILFAFVYYVITQIMDKIGDTM